MTTCKDNPSPAAPPLASDGVSFADAFSRELLGARLAAVDDPSSHGAVLVKQNASRTIWRARFDGHEVYVKHFHGRSLAHRVLAGVGVSHARREARFFQAMAAAGLPTAKLLAWCASGRRQWVCTLGVQDATPGDVWHEQQRSAGPAGLSRVRQATATLARLVGHMHRAGILHGDLHAGNVLVREEGGTPSPQLVLMDLHRMKVGRSLSRRAMAKNLSQLFHDRVEFTTRSDRMRFLVHYIEALRGGGEGSWREGTRRGWQILVEKYARPHSRRQFANRDRRVWGDGRYFTKLSLGGGWRGSAVLSSKFALAGSRAATLTFTTADWQTALSDPAVLLDESTGELVKRSASGTVLRRRLRVGPHELDVYVKRPRRKRPWKVLIDCFRPARPMRAFALGHELLNRRLLTALPLACLERRVGGVLLDSILVTETVDGNKLTPFLNTWLARPAKGDVPLTGSQQHHLAQQVLWQMGRMLQRLHDHNYAHRDLKSNNLIVRWSPGQNAELVVLDLDGLKRQIRVSARRRFQGLMRLNVSLLESPVVNHAGRLRMLLGYLRRPGSGRVAFKPYWRTLEDWSAKKLKQQLKARQKRQRATRR